MNNHFFPRKISTLLVILGAFATLFCKPQDSSTLYEARSASADPKIQEILNKATKRVWVFRVQSGPTGIENKSKELLKVSNQSVRWSGEFANGHTLNVSFYTIDHLQHFAAKRSLEHSKIVSFQIPVEFFTDKIAKNIVYQANAGGTAKPKLVDPTTPGLSIEFPLEAAKDLIAKATPGSAREESWADFARRLKLSACFGLNDFDTSDETNGLDNRVLMDEVFKYIDFEDQEKATEGFSLASCGTSLSIDQNARANGRQVGEDVARKVDEVRRAAQDLANLPSNASSEAVSAAQQVLREKQLAAKAAAGAGKKLFQAAKFAGGKIIPVVGAAAEVVGLALGIAEAVDIKKNGGSDAAAAAAVLSGMGLAGAIPAVIACEDCSPDEKAAAFFSGFLGIDFTHLVVCPGKRCPRDEDLARFSGDWSMRRVKRSCDYGHPATGTSHGWTQLQVLCSPKRTTHMVSTYRFVDNGDKESRWHYPLYCNDDEYLAGVSFAVTTLYGIKSVLCAKPDVPFGGRCQEIRAESCPQHQFLRGIYVDRAYRDKGKMGVFCDRTQRNDDLFEYCDQISKIKCCDY